MCVLVIPFFEHSEPNKSTAITRQRRVHEESKFRVAIGVFDDLTRLNQTLNDFRIIGLDITRTVVLADRGALGGGLEAKFNSADAGGDRDTPVLLVRGKTEGNLENAEIFPARQMLHFEDWISEKLSDDLNERLADGACVLIAPVANVQMEWRMSNALLKHSAGVVQLHDLAILN